MVHALKNLEFYPGSGFGHWGTHSLARSLTSLIDLSHRNDASNNRFFNPPPGHGGNPTSGRREKQKQRLIPISVSGGQPEHIPDFLPDCSPARKCHMSAFGDEQRGIDGPED